MLIEPPMRALILCLALFAALLPGALRAAAQPASLPAAVAVAGGDDQDGNDTGDEDLRGRVAPPMASPAV
jgi:hypothetical protein